MKFIFFILSALVLLPSCSSVGQSPGVDFELHEGQVKRILMNTEQLDHVKVIRETI